MKVRFLIELHEISQAEHLGGCPHMCQSERNNKIALIVTQKYKTP